MRLLFKVLFVLFILYWLGISYIDLTGLFNWIDQVHQVSR